MSREVHFQIYRHYRLVRQDANNAMVALLAGSALAADLLKSQDGSVHSLPEIYPRVPHLKHMRLRPGAAISVLRESGLHLATVAVPYAISIHEHGLWPEPKRFP